MQKACAYGVAGTLMKIAADIAFSWHILFEPVYNTELIAKGKEYECKFRTYMILDKYYRNAFYKEIIPGNNATKSLDRIAHRLGGWIFPSRLLYYFFELYGECYVPYEEDDFYADGNSGKMFDKDFDNLW
jgi:hypothetical protein